MKRFIGICGIAAVIGLACCNSTKKQSTDMPQPDSDGRVIAVNRTGSQAMMPQATVFRMSGDYADRVGVTLNPDGSFLYYPAPSDITSLSSPVSLDDGWWLNRQGLGAGSVFTRWTFEEYASLPATPSQEEIKAAIIPGARVTEMRALPIPLTDALADPDACKKYLIE